MEMLYYHNPRCSKSCQGLEMLIQSGKPFQVKEYLKEPLTATELDQLFHKLKKSPLEMIRKKEPIYKDLDMDIATMSSTDWIKVIIENPILLERPILETKDTAIIGHPSENFQKVLEKL